MGVVVRQGLKSTVVQFVGVAVGVASTLFLWPLALEVLGLVQALVAAAMVIAPLATLGGANLAVRYYAPFREPDAGRRGLLTLSLAVVAAGIALTVLAWPLVDEWVARAYFPEDLAKGRRYLVAVPVMIAAIALMRVLAQYTSNFRRVVVPTILDQFAFKITLPALVLLFLAGAIGTRGVVIGTLLHWGLMTLGMVAYLWHLGELRLPRIDASLITEWREMARYSVYSITAQLASNLAFRIDQVMIPAYLGFAAGGTYSIAMFVSEVIAKPFANLRNVTAPIVAEAWAEEDMAEMQTLYRKSSDNLLLICGYLFAGIAVCYPGLIGVASRGEVLAQAFPAFLVLGLSRVVDAGTSINDLIITYSKRYTFNLVAVVLLAGINLALNVFLIPRYGFVGAALATLTSVTLANLAKVIFVGLVWGLWPFGKTSLEVVVALGVAGALAWVLPLTGYWWLDSGLKGGLLTALLAGYVWWRPPSKELRGLMLGAWARVRGA